MTLPSDTPPLPNGRGSDGKRGSDREHRLQSAAPHSDALAYLITFHTYGTWLHGDGRGSVDDAHNIPGTVLFTANARWKAADVREMKDPPLDLDDACRAVVGRTIREVAEHRGWTICALNVRTNHVHVVVGAAVPPERVMNDFKSWSTRRLIEAGLLEKGRKVWAHHGSTRYLWNEKSVEDACRYVVEGQGVDLNKPMS